MVYVNCNMCGSRLKPNARKCENCGSQVDYADRARQQGGLEVNSVPQSSQVQQAPATTTTTAKRESPRKKKSVIDLRPFIILIVLGYIGFTNFNSIKQLLFPEPTETPQQVTPAETPAIVPGNEVDIAALVRDLNEGAGEAKQKGCVQAAQIQHWPPELVTAVLSNIDNSDANVSCGCVWSIGFGRDNATTAIPRLEQYVSDKNSPCRNAGLDSLAMIGSKTSDPKILQLLVDALTDNVDLIRMGAIRGLISYGPASDDLIPKVIPLAADPSEPVRRAALEFLGSKAKNSEKLSVTLPVLIRGLNDSVPAVRMTAVETIGEIGSSANAAIQPLAKHIQDTDANVAAAAVEAIGKIGAGSAIALPYLIEGLRHPDHNVRKLAVLHVAELGPEAAPAVPHLIPILNGEEIYLRVWAAEALGNIGPAASPAIPRFPSFLGSLKMTMLFRSSNSSLLNSAGDS